MDLLRLTNKLSQTEFLPETSILRKSIRQTPEIIKVLLKLVLRRQRYCFQFFKYFVLFPSSSQMSETQSIDSYDKLIFGDDAIHSVVKIFESKQLQNMIWAFINIKALKYLQNCKIFTKKMSDTYVEKLEKPVQRHAFQMIKQYDVQVEDKRMDKNKNNSKYINQSTNTSHKQKLRTMLNIYEVKIDGKNYFNSNIMIQSSDNEELKSITQSNKFINVQNTKLTQSNQMAQDLNINQSQENPSKISKISLKSQTSKQKIQDTYRHSIQAPSQTKIRFIYTSPAKQQLIWHQESQKTIIKQLDHQKRKDQNTKKYMYSVPKIFQHKQICCDNLCGVGCGDKCLICKGPVK